jgi:hypothetical protein
VTFLCSLLLLPLQDDLLLLLNFEQQASPDSLWVDGIPV